MLDPKPASTEACDHIYDPLQTAVLADPYPVFHRLRVSGAVRWHDRLASWVVTTHAACNEVLHRTDTFASDFRRIGESVPLAALSIQMLDPPEHTPIRHLLAAAMRDRSVKALTGELTRVVRRRIADTVGDGGFDFVAQVARPVALDTISFVLGMTPPGGDEFEAVSNAIVRSMDGGLDPSRVEPGRAARRQLSEWVQGWMSTSSDGLLGYVAAHRDEYGVSADLAANSLRAVLHAGYESVSRLLGNAAAVLADHPALAGQLRDRAVRQRAVEEFIRFDPPVQADARACVADTVLAGTPIRSGEVVVLLLGAANRDPDAFDRPDTFVADRTPNRHLGFGVGAHACLGAQLARILVTAVLDEVVAGNRVLVPVGTPDREPTATLRGLRCLPVRWQPQSVV